MKINLTIQFCCGGDIIKNKAVISVCAVAFVTNFILFITKLYVGLSANSISIYSDGVNNLFDSLSGVLSVICLVLSVKSADLSVKSRSEKTEQFLSFVLSVIVAFAGFVFLYNSAERLMYPTPVWFSVKYFAILSITALVKLAMFIFFKVKAKALQSEILRVMSADSLMDFFITAITVATMAVSQKGTYSLDAYCGILISTVIVISGVKMVLSNAKLLMNLPVKSEREKIESLIFDFGLEGKITELEFSFGEDKKVFLKTDAQIDEEKLTSLKKAVLGQVGYNIYIVK